MAATITFNDVNVIFDYVAFIAKQMLTAYGQRNEDQPIVGWGESGIALLQRELETNFLFNTEDLELSNAIGPSVYQLRAQSTPQVIAANYFSDLFSRYGQVIQAAGLAPNVVTIDQALAYWNGTAGGPNLAMQSPYIRFVMEALGMNPSRGNFCYPVFGSGLHVGTQLGGVFSGGNRVVDTAKYVGGLPRLKFSTFSSNNGAVTVTGECWNPATQAIEVGKTWITTGGTFTNALEERQLIPGGPTPAPANALMTKATAMSGVNAGNRFDVRLYGTRSFEEWVV